MCSDLYRDFSCGHFELRKIRCPPEARCDKLKPIRLPQYGNSPKCVSIEKHGGRLTELYRRLNDLRGVRHEDSGRSCGWCADKLTARNEIGTKTIRLLDLQAALRDKWEDEGTCNGGFGPGVRIEDIGSIEGPEPVCRAYVNDRRRW